jgi:putative FmdB family regulatory protein
MRAAARFTPGEGSERALVALPPSVPIYEYKCPNGHLFEVFHGMTEAGPTVCEECGEGPLKRVLHPVAVHYKGSGFYSTDYGRKSKQPSKDGSSGEGSSSSPSESGGGSSTGSDSGGSAKPAPSSSSDSG